MILYTNIKETERNAMITISNNNILLTKNIKYLGVYLNNLMKNYHQIKHILRKANAAKSLLYPIMNVNSGVSNNVKLMCYKQLIRPQITYGFPIWFNTSPCQMNKISILERKCLRQAIDFKRTQINFKYIKNEELYNKTNIIKIENFMFLQFEKFINNMQYVENDLIKNIFRESENLEYQATVCNQTKYMSPISLKFLIHTHRIYNHLNELIFYNPAIS